MTQIDEPNLDEQLERIASIACGAELGLLDDEIVDEDIKRMNATTRANKDRLKKLIEALIATQIQEAYKKGYIDGKLEGFDVAFDCHDYDRLRAYRADIAQLRSTQ